MRNPFPINDRAVHFSDAHGIRRLVLWPVFPLSLCVLQCGLTHRCVSRHRAVPLRGHRLRSAARRCREGEAGSSGILEPGREGFEEPTVTLFLLHEEGRSPCQGLHGDLGFSDGSFPGRRVWLPTVSAAKASRDDWIGSQSEQQNQREPWGLRFHIPAPATTIRFFCWMSHGTKKTKGLKAMTRS